MLIPTSLWGTFLTLFPRSPILADHGSMMEAASLIPPSRSFRAETSYRLLTRDSP